MLLVVAPLILLLPLLAVLQYRWQGEVSLALRERMQANLRTSAEKLCADFDRELTNIYVQFQSPALPSSDLIAADFASRYHRWIAGAPNPKLVRDIYRTAHEVDGTLKLMRFDISSNSFEPVDWPENLNSLRNRFEIEQNADSAAHNIFRGLFKQTTESPAAQLPKVARSFILQVSSGLTAAEIPALIVPEATEPGMNQNALVSRKRSSIIAVLDVELIRKEILPSLIKRYFSTDDQSEYNLAVIRTSSKPSEAIFQTDNKLPMKAFEQSDSRSSLFRIRAEDLDRIFVSSGGKAIAPMLSLGMPIQQDKNEQTEKTKSSQVAVRVLQSDVQVTKSGESPIAVPRTSSIELRRPFTPSLDGDGGWQLLVKHRAGSLDAAVSNIRRRNLVISFGILLLLGVSVGFIVLSSRRAERLATQQMEFVAGVSHELRTPLAVICSAAENLADGVIDNRDQIKRYGGLIRDEGRRLTGMVEQVLEFAGAQSGRRPYELRPTDLNQVIEDAIAASHLQFLEGGFELEKYVPADLPMVNADAAALSRAIQNLLSNAMKYSGESRWIGLGAEIVKAQRGEEIRIKVSDQGLGIQPSELPHIFEPFYRGKEVIASQIHGNGLGLSLVKHIAAAHQGQVRVESILGQGSQFILSLPLISKQEITAEVPKDIYEQAHPAR